jgi:hypothetical protein
MRKGILGLVGLAVLLVATLALLPTGDTVSAASSGFLNPSANAADTGGDNNGFESNPAYAYTDNSSYANNVNGAGDRHRYYNYGISVPGDATITGIEVRLDWWLDSTSGTSSMDVELSWDGGTSWTSYKRDSQESRKEHSVTLGGSTDTWGHAWTVAELTNANFRVRLTCNSDSSSRDFRLDWVPVNVYYTAGTPEPTPTPPPASVEGTYTAQGAWAVSTGTANDGLGNAFHLWYPTNLGAGGYLHPILTWGNGTGATPSQYADTLDHLASWGFVIIASDSGSVGEGYEMLAGAQYMVAKNSDSGSIFYNKLATNKIGAFGHSQGAGGTLNCVLLSPSLFKSAITNALPNPLWWSTPVPDMSTWPTSVPIWFTRGSKDTFIATESAAVTWYNAVPGPAAKATLIGADHNTIQTANNGYQAYYVAWFKYTLEGDSFARTAFAGASPEVAANAGWQNWAAKNLP